ncbi:MAG: hypothetical protein ACT4QG_04085 [Sporichthyaceae bacterium]
MIDLRLRRAAGVLALASLLAACADSPQASAPRPGVPATPDPRSADVREDGWVWESYRDVEVAVPPGWFTGTGDVGATQWCISDTTYAIPFVVRPGIPPEATCATPAPGAADPATLIGKGGTFVSFAKASAFPDVVLGDAGDRTTRIVGSVLLRVQAPADVRAKILASARQITSDVLGCATSDPISTDPYRRPDPARRLADLGDVTRVVACKYVVSAPAPVLDSAATPVATPAAAATAGATLFSSVEILGEPAARAVRAIAGASGGGPNDVEGCPSPNGVGTEAIVLRIYSSTGVSQAYLRYGGCNGVDDGTGYYALTRDGVAPFVSGANAVAEFGESLNGILDDLDAPATSGDPG